MNTGQKITVITAFSKKGKNGFHTTVINHSANKHWDITSAGFLLSCFYLSTSPFWFLLKTTFLTMAIVLSGAPFYLAAVYLLYASISYFSRVSKIFKALKKHMESNTLEAYSY